VALAVAEDGLEDLHLIGFGDACEVRRIARGIGVVQVAAWSRRVELAGLEDDVAVRSSDYDVQPGRAKGRPWAAVSSKVLNTHCE